MKKFIIIISSVALAGCFASKKVVTPTDADVARGAAKFSGYTLADLTEGKKLYEANCGSCHALKKPTAENEATWRREVPVMVKKVNKNSMVLDAHAEEMILRYVVTMSGK
jgi:cytochrome c5